jgi:hypothetical protein
MRKDAISGQLSAVSDQLKEKKISELAQIAAVQHRGRFRTCASRS